MTAMDTFMTAEVQYMIASKQRRIILRLVISPAYLSLTWS